MIAKSIAEYLEDRGVGTVGTDIFIGEFPSKLTSTTESGIYIVADGGGGQDSYLDTLYGDFSFWSVSPVTTTAHNALETIRGVLSRATNYDTDDYLVYYSQDISGIIDLDRSVDGLKIYKMTIRFIYHDKSIIS